MYRILKVSLLVLCAACLPVRALALENAGEVQLTREGKASVELALKYLAGMQHSDGTLSWNLGSSTAIVAAACLAWMANGSLPGEGPYGRNVALGVSYLLSQAQPTGLLCKLRDGSPMYNHGLATICLAEAWGQTRDKHIQEKLKKAVDLIIHCQNEKGGWRYQPNISDDDLSVVVMQLLALRASKDAGIAVPKEVIERAIGYVEMCKTGTDPDGVFGYSYQPRGGRGFATTAAGLMSLMLCGNYKAAYLKGGLDWLVRMRETKGDNGTWFIYGHYYAAQAMYQAGGQGEKFQKYWQKWYPDISKQLIGLQVTKGPGVGRFQCGADSYGTWSTSMSVLILGIPYRYLPIYQR